MRSSWRPPRAQPATQQLVSISFAPEFLPHLIDVVRRRPQIQAYDFHLDGDHIGSIVVNKYLARRYGVFVPMISIESIAVTCERRGYGTIMLAWCKELLFTDRYQSDDNCGIIVGQCVQNGFWSDALDATTTARERSFTNFTTCARHRATTLKSSASRARDTFMRATRRVGRLPRKRSNAIKV